MQNPAIESTFRTRVQLLVGSILKKYEWSHSQLAKEIGVTRQAVTYYACGSKFPNTLTLSALCQLAGIRIEDLFTPGDFNATAREPASLDSRVRLLEHRVSELEGQLSKYRQDRIDKIKSLSPEQRQTIRDLVDQVVAASAGTSFKRTHAGVWSRMYRLYRITNLRAMRQRDFEVAHGYLTRILERLEHPKAADSHGQ